MRYHVGQAVIYQGKRYYIIAGPIMSTQGAIYEISPVPPPIAGIHESDLQPAPPEDE